MVSISELNRLFYYNKDTGNLHRKITVKGSSAKPDDVVGVITFNRNNSTKYLRIQVNKKQYKVHRIIYMMVTNEEIPEKMEIDHIDGNGLNNKWENLRLVTPEENRRNMPIPSHNTSGIVGVSKTKFGSFKAQIKIRNLNINRQKQFKTLEEAIDQRKKWEKEFQYHQNNGR